MNIKKYPSQRFLLDTFDYLDGKLYWKNPRKGSKGRDVPAGYQNENDKYFYVTIDYIRYKHNRLVYIYHHGDIPDGLLIDHIDKIRTNDKIENLRPLSRTLNALHNNCKCVRYRKDRNKYQGYIRLDGRFISKTFNTEEEALTWVEEEKSKIFKKNGLTF